MTTAIQTEQKGAVLIIRIDRPAQKNALTHEMYTLMGDHLQAADENPEIRAVLFTGNADCFTAGNDLSEFADGLDQAFAETPVGRFLLLLARATTPVVAAVNGPAVGIGTTMLLHCDLVYAGQNTRFQMPFVNLGLCPEGGSSLLLPRWIGRVRACELLMLGGPFDVAAADKLGLINGICDPEQTEVTAMDACERLAAQPAAAIRATKELLRQGEGDELDYAMLAEGARFFERLKSPEAAEAFAAFREKRKPDFSRFD